MKEPQSRQAVATVGGGATTKNSSKGFVNWVKNHKLGVDVGALTAATAVTLTILGVKYWGKKESVGNPNKGNEPIENEVITEKDKDNATVGSKLDILEKDADDRKKIIKEHNEKIINDVINEKNDIKTNSKSDEIHIAIAQGMGIKTKLDGEGEKQLIANIDKIKNLVLNKKDYFKNNFVSYSQFNFHVPGQNPPSLDGKL